MDYSKFINNKTGFFDAVFTMDIGVNTAIAEWRGTEEPYTYFIKCPVWKIKDPQQQRLFMYDEFSKHLRLRRPNLIVIEGVRIYASLKSMTSAKRGDLVNLSYLIGGFEALCWSYGNKSNIITAQEWKGQLTKKATEHRLKLLQPNYNYENEHIIDAVAMGWSLVGKFTWNKGKYDGKLPQV